VPLHATTAGATGLKDYERKPCAIVLQILVGLGGNADDSRGPDRIGQRRNPRKFFSDILIPVCSRYQHLLLEDVVHAGHAS
jgi:hypothetical protein